jgi:hypothetical protein
MRVGPLTASSDLFNECRTTVLKSCTIEGKPDGRIYGPKDGGRITIFTSGTIKGDGKLYDLGAKDLVSKPFVQGVVYPDTKTCIEVRFNPDEIGKSAVLEFGSSLQEIYLHLPEMKWTHTIDPDAEDATEGFVPPESCGEHPDPPIFFGYRSARRYDIWKNRELSQLGIRSILMYPRPFECQSLIIMGFLDPTISDGKSEGEGEGEGKHESDY